MPFVDKVDKIEQMEQKFWPIAFKKAKEKAEKIKAVLSPRSYKMGVLGQIASLFLGLLWIVVFLSMLFMGLIAGVSDLIFDPGFAGWEENIFHEPEEH